MKKFFIKFKEQIKNFLKGMGIGAACIVPGVSAQSRRQIAGRQRAVEKRRPPGQAVHIGQQEQCALNQDGKQRKDSKMDARDFQHRSAALLSQREIISHAENHQGADGLGKKRCTGGNNTADADPVQPDTDSGQIQGQAQKAHNHQRRGKYLFDDLRCRGILAGVRG